MSAAVERALSVRCPRCCQPPGCMCSKGLYAYVETRRPHHERSRAALDDTLTFVPTGCDCDAIDGYHGSRCAIYYPDGP